MLRTENGGNFKNPFINGHKRLLIKLRTLRQINGFAEIIEFKNVCAAFSAGKIYFRRMDFSEILALQIFSESALNSFLNFKNSSFFGVAQCNGTVIEINRKFTCNLLFLNNYGRNSRRGRQNFYIMDLKFESFASVASLALNYFSRNFSGRLFHYAFV